MLSSTSWACTGNILTWLSDLSGRRWDFRLHLTINLRRSAVVPQGVISSWSSNTLLSPARFATKQNFEHSQFPTGRNFSRIIIISELLFCRQIGIADLERKNTPTSKGVARSETNSQPEHRNAQLLHLICAQSSSFRWISKFKPNAVRQCFLKIANIWLPSSDSNNDFTHCVG